MIICNGVEDDAGAPCMAPEGVQRGGAGCEVRVGGGDVLAGVRLEVASCGPFRL